MCNEEIENGNKNRAPYVYWFILINKWNPNTKAERKNNAIRYSGLFSNDPSIALY
tara:strand:- start:525 stop:689 length:165 start_codon:yes stop_codon:yes gene_type:complete